MSFLNQIDDISKQLSDVANERTLVYVGRFCPIHYGHQAMIGGIIRASQNKGHMICVGSCNQPLSCRHLFDIRSRVRFIHTVCPAARLVPLPDYGDDASWFMNLDMMIRLYGRDPKDVTFVGGCLEDVQWYIDHKRDTFIVNRFSGVTDNISGTEIRDHLITGNEEKLVKLLDFRIVPDVLATFRIQWDKLRKM